MKKISAVAVLAVMTISLAGCGQSAKPEKLYETFLKEMKADIKEYDKSGVSAIEQYSELLQFAVANLDSETVTNQLVYSITDVNGDENPELLVAMNFDGQADLVGVYAIEEGEAKAIINPSYDSYYTITESGKVINEGMFVESFYYMSFYHFEGNELVGDEFAYTTCYDPKTGERDDSKGYTVIGTDNKRVQDIVLGQALATDDIQTFEGTEAFWTYADGEKALAVEYKPLSELK